MKAVTRDDLLRELEAQGLWSAGILVAPNLPYQLPMMSCIGSVCFAPVDASIPKFFGFSEFLTGLALIALAWTTADFRYRFRINTAPIPLRGLMFTSVLVIGLLTLLTDVWRAERWLVPQGDLLTAATWQGLLGLLLLAVFFAWGLFAFLRPPVFGRRNAKRFLAALYRAVVKGSQSELAVISEEFARSVASLIRHAPQPDRYRAMRGKSQPSEPRLLTAELANDILLLIGDRRMCRAMVSAAPGTIWEIFHEIGKTQKYEVRIETFARNVLAEALANKDSFLYHETEGYDTGLIGFHKPVSQAMFGNSELVGEIPGVFDPDFTEMGKWEDIRWEAYCRMVLMTLRDFARRGLRGNAHFLYGPIRHIERACSDLYKLNGAPNDVWDNEAFQRLRTVVGFFKEALKILNASPIPDHTLLRVREKYGPRRTIYDDLAAGIADVIFDASAVRSPIMLCWMIQHNTVWAELFGFLGSEGTATDMIQFKVRRLLYDEIKQMESFPNYKGARYLGFCLNVMGLTLRQGDMWSDSYALQKAVLSWTRCNFAELCESNPSVAKECLMDGFTYQRKRHRIVKTYPADGLLRKPQYEYFEVLPRKKNENDDHETLNTAGETIAPAGPQLGEPGT